ncbi:MAG: glycosyl transferase [Desulfuromonas sp.]|nr:MAG: glycosyl transferase [Desulfuromonas sp.]
MNILFWLALTAVLFYLAVALELVRGNRSIDSLGSVSSATPEPLPKVSIIVAARNEERHIRAALTALLHFAYPDYELIVVNDRSEDTTGEILENLATDYPHLKIVNITKLPEHWLGKNHALWLGSDMAQGELLLFTDADIYMEKTLLKRAVNRLQGQQLDHLVVSPRMDMPGALLQMLGLTFMMIFAMFSRPWKAREPGNRYHIGIGAFNLVRASAYRAVDGHRAIHMRPDDDLKLGKLLKINGFRQDIIAGPDFIHVEWYASVRELVVGLEKNAFAGCDYRLWLSVSGVLLLLLFSVWPFVALLLTSGVTWWLYAATAAIILGLQLECARTNRVNPWYALGWPLAATMIAWIFARTTWLNLRQGGITWRGTFYPLSELRKNRV